MADTVSKRRRSEIMSHIRSSGTAVEISLRSLLFRAGYRFRKNVRKLPGVPDIVLRKHRVVVFIDGCFWHGHLHCPDGRLPKSNVKYWREKILNNKKRDLRNRRALRNAGWKVLCFWACQIDNSPEKTIARILSALGSV